MCGPLVWFSRVLTSVPHRPRTMNITKWLAVVLSKLLIVCYGIKAVRQVAIMAQVQCRIYVLDFWVLFQKVTGILCISHLRKTIHSKLGRVSIWTLNVQPIQQMLLLLQTMTISLFLLTHCSNYHLLGFAFLFYMGDIMCYLIAS